MDAASNNTADNQAKGQSTPLRGTAAIPVVSIVIPMLNECDGLPVLFASLKQAIASTPDLILQSKPDIHDTHGALKDFLSTNPYRVTGKLPGFSIWEKSNDNPNRP
jgi:hypothetical protein